MKFDKIPLTTKERSFLIEATQVISNIDEVDRTKLLRKLGIEQFIG